MVDDESYDEVCAAKLKNFIFLICLFVCLFTSWLHACSFRVEPCAPCVAASPISSLVWATRYHAVTLVTPATVASSTLSATVAELATTAHPDAPDPTDDVTL